LLSIENPGRDPLTTALIRKHRNGEAGASTGKLMAEGDGWRVLDLVCTAGPHDRPFEERHAWTSLSMVLAGTFAYRSDRGSSLMSSGALLLGNAGQQFECSHRHGEGDRCVSFQFAPQVFEDIARDAGSRHCAFHHDRVAPLRILAPLTARIAAALDSDAPLEEIALELAGTVMRLEHDNRGGASSATPNPARIAEVLHHLEARLEERHTLASLARIADLSRYHFLRTFTRVTGITPYQWILRARLRAAATRIATSSQPITEIALAVGCEDLSNFIRGFRTEFGISPRAYRATMSQKRSLS
jgi:AraC family transcriptional regulator